MILESIGRFECAAPVSRVISYVINHVTSLLSDQRIDKGGTLKSINWRHWLYFFITVFFLTDLLIPSLSPPSATDQNKSTRPFIL
jgi:hypothetical protein